MGSRPLQLQWRCVWKVTSPPVRQQRWSSLKTYVFWAALGNAQSSMSVGVDHVDRWHTFSARSHSTQKKIFSTRSNSNRLVGIAWGERSRCIAFHSHFTVVRVSMPLSSSTLWIPMFFARFVDCAAAQSLSVWAVIIMHGSCGSCARGGSWGSWLSLSVVTVFRHGKVHRFAVCQPQSVEEDLDVFHVRFPALAARQF